MESGIRMWPMQNKKFSMRHFLFVVVLLSSFSVVAQGAVIKCPPKELQLKNCVLRGKDIKVSFSDNKIRFNYGPWTSIVNFPFSGLISDWKEVHLVQFGEHSFVVVKVWEELEKEVSLEELHWRVMELAKRKLIIHVDEVLGKRKKRVDKEEPAIKDVLQPESLTQDSKTGEIHWSVGKKTGVIPHGL